MQLRQEEASMDNKVKKMFFNQRLVFFIDLAIGFICLSIVPTGVEFFIKIPALICFAIVFYFCFQTLLRLYDPKIHGVGRFFLMVGWCMFLSLITIIISLLSIEILHSSGYNQNLLQQIFGIFIMAGLGLIFTSPVWFSTAVINFLILRPK